jgi:hypothetical protein
VSANQASSQMVGKQEVILPIQIGLAPFSRKLCAQWKCRTNGIVPIGRVIPRRVRTLYRRCKFENLR